MTKLLARTSVLLTAAALFTTGLMLQGDSSKMAAPTSLSVMDDQTLASGPTIPPGPYDEEESGSGGTKIASGPTIPPGPYDEEESGSGGTKIASGPTIPPGPYDEEESGSGGTKVV